MKTRMLAVVAVGGVAGMLAGLGLSRQPSGQPAAPAAKQPAEKQTMGADESVLTGKMKLIDGKEQDLSAYKGKVVLIVNVASKCGYTGQYAPLEKLYKEKKGEGLVVLGFPANDFGKQEPGSNEEIVRFCTEKFDVTFPMFEKISVKGEGAAPLYKKLVALPAPLGGDPKWNFTKFVVDRKGHVVARFDPKKKDGLEDGLVERVEEELKKK